MSSFEAKIDYTTESPRRGPVRKTKNVSAKTSEGLASAVSRAVAKLEDRNAYNVTVRFATEAGYFLTST